MSASIALTVADVTVSQNAYGRFSLNDLHRASGGRAKHRPAQWLRSEPVKSLISELEGENLASNCAYTHNSGEAATAVQPVATAAGSAGGTYVVRELVYAYAMWISAAFHLKVIRAYDALMRLGLGGNAKRSALNVTTAVRLRATLIGLIHKSADAGVARGYHHCLQIVDSELGMQSEELEEIAPHLRQQSLPGV